jgi:dihydrodipicolinate synthase/N-acetylneuraminate lyase
MYMTLQQGQLSQAQELASVVARLTAVLFRESNPAPVKYALSLMHIMLPRVRLPLVEPNSETKAEIEATLLRTYEKYSGYLVAKPFCLDKKAADPISRGGSKPKLVVIS